MQDSLRAMVAQVRDSSRNIATASEQIAAGNHDLSGRTEQTSGNVQQTVTSMSGLTQTVEHTARSAQQANELASSASQAAVRGGTVVEQAVSSMHDISSSSQRIGDIIGLIDSIAFQTNILAGDGPARPELESLARAGVQGRGFAVVASEVRALANKTATAASEIKTLIGGSVQAIGVGVRLVEDAGSAMKEIVEGVQRVTNIISEITSAASVQSLGIGQMNVAVGEIDQMTQQNAALVEQSAAAAESLKAHATYRVVVNGNTDTYGGAQNPELPLLRARAALANGRAQLEQHRAGELLAEDLRVAQQALGEITGEFSADDLLGRIFSRFCIGK